MFSKPNKSVTANMRPEGLEAPARKPIPFSLIAETVTLEGDLSSNGDVQIDGAVRGDLKVTHLSVGETGQIEGSISAETAEIRGLVVGAITAKTIRLHASAKVEGDLTHLQLSIDSGAQFIGRSIQLTPSAPAEGSVAPAAAE